jgi:hypothetical protein
MKATRPAPADYADELAEIEPMIIRLGELPRGTHDRALRGAYQAALDRLDALAHRLNEGAGPRTIGPPARPLKGSPHDLFKIAR